MMKKRGSSHVEVIISFVIFVGFLIFFYTIMEPAIKGPRSSETVSEDLQDRILTQISGEVKDYSFNVKESENGIYPEGCIKFLDYLIKGNTSVKDETGEYIDSLFNSDNSLSISEAPSRGQGYSIYYSNEFKAGTAGICPTTIIECSGSESPNEYCYNLNFQKKRQHIFETKIEKLKDYYENEKTTNFINIKNELKIPSDYDFWFDFLDENKVSKFGEGWIKPDIPENVNVYASEIPITYIDSINQDPKDKKSGFLEIEVWG